MAASKITLVKEGEIKLGKKKNADSTDVSVSVWGRDYEKLKGKGKVVQNFAFYS